MPQKSQEGWAISELIVEGKRYVLGVAPAGLSLRLNFVSVSV